MGRAGVPGPDLAGPGRAGATLRIETQDTHDH
jgi:hypothetical protein